jgi:hypothetical protein
MMTQCCQGFFVAIEVSQHSTFVVVRFGEIRLQA